MDNEQLHDEGMTALWLGPSYDYGDYGRVSVSDAWLEERVRQSGTD